MILKEYSLTVLLLYFVYLIFLSLKASLHHIDIAILNVNLKR